MVIKINCKGLVTGWSKISLSKTNVFYSKFKKQLNTSLDNMKYWRQSNEQKGQNLNTQTTLFYAQTSILTKAVLLLIPFNTAQTVVHLAFGASCHSRGNDYGWVAVPDDENIAQNRSDVAVLVPGSHLQFQQIHRPLRAVDAGWVSYAAGLAHYPACKQGVQW